MIRLENLCWIAMSAVVLLTVRAQAQVDWGPLLDGKGTQPKVEAAPQHPEAPPPTPVPRPLVHDTGRVRVTPVHVRHSATPHPRRHVPRIGAEDEPEYPAAPRGRQY